MRFVAGRRWIKASAVGCVGVAVDWDGLFVRLKQAIEAP
jgi:hypothetical protein